MSERDGTHDDAAGRAAGSVVPDREAFTRDGAAQAPASNPAPAPPKPPEPGTADLGRAAEAGPDAAAPAAAGPAMTAGRTPSEIEARVIEVLRTCFDPEIPVDIYELGLIYSIEVTPAGHAGVRMTLTSPMCPVAGSLPPEVEAKVRGIAGVTSATVEVVWDPPWNPSMMSEAAKLQLNMM